MRLSKLASLAPHTSVDGNPPRRRRHFIARGGTSQLMVLLFMPKARLFPVCFAANRGLQRRHTEVSQNMFLFILVCAHGVNCAIIF